MRKKEPLTTSQKEYITANWQDMKWIDIADNLELKSVFKVHQFCEEQGFKKRGKKGFTESDKQFVRNNFSTMTERQMAKQLETSKYYIRELKELEGLIKSMPRKPAKVLDGNFDLEEWGKIYSY